jgi:hypothetical protein
MNCTRCGGSGFLNIGQVDTDTLRRFDATGDVEIILAWITVEQVHDVVVCDCCGNGETWYYEPGRHCDGEPADCN